MRRKNPYLVSYLSMALICCLIISVVFVYINNMNLQKEKAKYNQEKVDLLAREIETQVEQFEEIVLKVRTTDVYRPFYFQKNKYNELLLLDDLKRYSNYSTIASEYFLYYPGNESIFHSSGDTVNLNVYLKDFSLEERERLLQMLPQVETPVVAVLDGTVIWLFPVKAGSAIGTNTVMGFMTGKEQLGEWFEFVSGGLRGNLSFTKGTTLLYHNQEKVYHAEDKKVLSATTKDGEYTVCYLPAETDFLVGGFVPVQIFLILMALLLVVLIAYMHAQRSYQPIMEIAEKYRRQVQKIPGGGVFLRRKSCKTAWKRLII